MERVSVIMSVYNQDKIKFVDESVKSILSQTYPDFELVLVDDGLTENDLINYLESLAHSDKRVKLLHNQNNEGLAYSMNRAIENSSGLFLARMDADDVMHPDRLKMQVKFLNKHSDIDVVGTFQLEIDEDGNKLNEVRFPTDHDNMVKYFGKRNPVGHVSAMMRKSFFEKAGKYSEEMKTDQDTVLWLEGLKKGARMGNVPEFLTSVRVSNDFYNRRAGFKKAVHDARNRIRVIKELNLSLNNYVYLFTRFIFQIIPSENLKRYGYKHIRRKI